MRLQEKGEEHSIYRGGLQGSVHKVQGSNEQIGTLPRNRVRLGSNYVDDPGAEYLVMTTSG